MTADAIAGRRNFRRDSLSGWTSVSVDAWRWLVRPDAVESLQHHPALRCDPAATMAGDLVKRGPHRTVRRFEHCGGEFYLKQFHRPDWRTTLRHLLRGSQARWEWSRFQRAVRHDIPTADVVAVGQQAGWGGESGLITRGLPGVTPLDEWVVDHSALLNFHLRRRLTDQLGRLVGRMHGRGVTHLDFHAGNILIRHEADGFQLWIVDLAPLRFRSQPAGLAEASQNLGRLRHSLLHVLSRTDEAAFFAAYALERKSTGLAAPQPVRPDNRRHTVMRDLSRRCDSVARACWEQMDRKWARGNRKTIVIDMPTVHCRGLAEVGRSSLEELCQSPERFLATTDSRLRFAGRTVLLHQKIGSRGWARRCWELGHALQRRMIAAPVPVWMLERHLPDGVVEAVACADEPDWQPLATILTETNRRFPQADLDEIGNRVVDLVQRAHDLGFTLNRLTVSSLELRRNHDRWQVRFASLVEIRQQSNVSLASRTNDLRSLAADLSTQIKIRKTQWLRWQSRYAQGVKFSHGKQGWRTIAAVTKSSEPRRVA